MIKKTAQDVKRKVSAMFELPKEVTLNLPFATVLGHEELHLENYKAVIEYTRETIRIKTSAGIMKIEGSNLTLKYVTQESISIIGSLSKIEYI